MYFAPDGSPATMNTLRGRWGSEHARAKPSVAPAGGPTPGGSEQRAGVSKRRHRDGSSGSNGETRMSRQAGKTPSRGRQFTCWGFPGAKSPSGGWEAEGTAMLHLPRRLRPAGPRAPPGRQGVLAISTPKLSGGRLRYPPGLRARVAGLAATTGRRAAPSPRQSFTRSDAGERRHYPARIRQGNGCQFAALAVDAAAATSKPKSR